MDMKKTLGLCFVLAALTACGQSGTNDTNSSASQAASEAVSATLLVWEDLMRMRQQMTLAEAAKAEDLNLAEVIAEGSDDDTMEQIGTFNVVESLNGEKIRIPGYIVPLDFSAKSEHDEFLLEPVWLEGTMKTGKFTSDLGNSAYELSLSKLEAYEY